MTAVLCDASAILAAMKGEPGGDKIADYDQRIITVVNASEVVAKLLSYGMTIDDVTDSMAALSMEIEPVTAADSMRAALLDMPNRRYGLSLADRFCLAVAERMALPVLTADRSWANVVTSASILVIR